MTEIDCHRVQTRLNLTFHPHPLVRNPHLQTILSSFYRPGASAAQRAAQALSLPVDDGVRLQGYYSPQPGGSSKGLALLLHGWLGEARAGYSSLVGDHLYARGYAIFRLNLRDHGHTHALNPGIFRGDLLAETFAATRRIARLESDRPFHIIGFSLGGSFALRLAWRHACQPIPNLVQTLAFCPVIDPQRVTARLDHGLPVYLAYFRRKWRRAYRHKMAAFPDRYDLSAVLRERTCLAMTEAFVKYTPYPTATDYFNSYTITPAMLAALRTPVSIIAAADDPIIPVADIEALRGASPYLQVYTQPYGGHVGFIDLFPFRLWSAEAALAILENVFEIA